jgi:hypothetical protein
MRYFFVQQDRLVSGGPFVETLVAECSSVEAARASVMDILASQMANMLQKAPTLHIGEVCFAAPGRESTCLLFARGTVAVHVQSVGDIEFPVQSFARRWDAQLEKWADGGSVPRSVR